MIALALIHTSASSGRPLVGAFAFIAFVVAFVGAPAYVAHRERKAER